MAKKPKNTINEEQPTATKARTAAEIQNEYANLCATAGQNNYQMKALEAANNRIFARFSELEAEMRAVKGSDERSAKP